MLDEPMNVAESLGHVLDQLMMSVQELLRLKRQGQQMMSRGNLEGLTAIITAQEELVDRLKALEAKRRVLGPRVSLDALSENIIGSHQALGAKLLQLRHTNELDALLIGAFSRLNEEQGRFIEWLQGARVTYENDGQRKDGPGLQGVSLDQRV